MTTRKVIVIGGGFAGCAAAVASVKAGLETVLIERTDLLLAGGNRAGRMNYNGKMVAAEEAKALGGGEIFETLESIVLHRSGLAGEDHGYTYDCCLAEPAIGKLLRDFGVQVLMEKRVVDAVTDGDRMESVLLDGRKEIKGDAFVDCTGTSGGLAVCKKYGHGCVMCGSYRCLVFGDRVSVAAKAGIKESDQCRPDGKPGLISAAVSLHKASLETGLRSRLENEGAVLVPMPENLIDYSKFEKIGSVGLREHQEYVNLVNIGPVVKCVKLGYLSLSELRTVPGLENAQIEDPLGGGKFGFIKLVAVTPRDNMLKVPTLSNLFVGGEKCGQVGGIAECLVTAILAGNNAARAAVGAELLELPRSTAIGDYIASTGENARKERPSGQGLRMGQGPYFQTMKVKGFYSPDPAHAHKRVKEAGLTGILARKV